MKSGLSAVIQNDRDTISRAKYMYYKKCTLNPYESDSDDEYGDQDKKDTEDSQQMFYKSQNSFDDFLKATDQSLLKE